jgi:enoyl-CoA hydratase/carnithine racemase
VSDPLLRQVEGAILSLTLNQPALASAAAQALCHATADHREAVDAFLEKRKPRFTGT